MFIKKCSLPNILHLSIQTFHQANWFYINYHIYLIRLICHRGTTSIRYFLSISVVIRGVCSCHRPPFKSIQTHLKPVLPVPVTDQRMPVSLDNEIIEYSTAAADQLISHGDLLCSFQISLESVKHKHRKTFL